MAKQRPGADKDLAPPKSGGGYVKSFLPRLEGKAILNPKPINPDMHGY
jgi:hypothetical protein